MFVIDIVTSCKYRFLFNMNMGEMYRPAALQEQTIVVLMLLPPLAIPLTCRFDYIRFNFFIFTNKGFQNIKSVHNFLFIELLWVMWSQVVELLVLGESIKPFFTIDLFFFSVEWIGQFVFFCKLYIFYDKLIHEAFLKIEKYVLLKFFFFNLGRKNILTVDLMILHLRVLSVKPTLHFVCYDSHSYVSFCSKSILVSLGHLLK